MTTMSSSSSTASDSNPSKNHKGGAFSTIKERVTFQKEIKKSKFIAIAGTISNERSAQAFLSEVRDPKATHNCWAYKLFVNSRSVISFGVMMMVNLLVRLASQYFLQLNLLGLTELWLS